MTDISAPRKQLMILRDEHGPASHIGSRCSLVIENLQNAEKPDTTPQLREMLLARAVATLAEIAAIKHGAPASTQIRPRDQ